MKKDSSHAQRGQRTEDETDTAAAAESPYFHLAAVKSRRMIAMITDMLKRLGTMCRAGSDGLEEHTNHALVEPSVILWSVRVSFIAVPLFREVWLRVRKHMTHCGDSTVQPRHTSCLSVCLSVLLCVRVCVSVFVFVPPPPLPCAHSTPALPPCHALGKQKQRTEEFSLNAAFSNSSCVLKTNSCSVHVQVGVESLEVRYVEILCVNPVKLETASSSKLLQSFSSRQGAGVIFDDGNAVLTCSTLWTDFDDPSGSLLLVDAHADRTALGVIGQSEEHVLLPAVADEEASQRSVPQHSVGVLHSQWSPVEPAALELGCCVRDNLAVLLAGKDRKDGNEWSGRNSAMMSAAAGLPQQQYQYTVTQ
ncbi:hypothetical protein INR49_028973 [Caranx melampygus]|nr:hypothetical protein INR49_028973 [Caranx melampygus]